VTAARGRLFGARVLLTRAAEDQATVATLIRERGGEALSLPCIAFAPPGDPAPLAALLDGWARGEKPAVLALASPQAARRFLSALEAKGLAPAAALAGVLIATTGAGTAAELPMVSPASLLVPDAGAGAEALVRALSARLGAGLRGARVALPRAEEGNPELPALLAAEGAAVEVAPLYRTVPADASHLATLDEAGQAALAALRANAVTGVLFGSGSAARGLAGLLGAEAAPLLARTRVLCMGEVCAADCLALGFAPALVSDGGFPRLLDLLEQQIEPGAASSAPPAPVPPVPGHAAHPKRAAGMAAIIAFKLVKACVSTTIGLLALLMLRSGAEALSATLAQLLLDHVTRAWALRAATFIVVAGTTAHIQLAAGAAFADATLSAIEGLALRAGRWWAPWLVVVATSVFLPWELLEVLRHPKWGRFLILAINLSVVLYLLRGVVLEHRERAAAGPD
jgi:uroporphyrinogen-III synthase/uncharacterized membrane protein (DUF2068 family)